MTIRFYCPKYIDQKILFLKVPLNNYLQDTDRWQNKNVHVNYTYYEQLQLMAHGTIVVSYRVQQGVMQLFLGDYQLTVLYAEKQYPIAVPVVVLGLDGVLLYLVGRMERKELRVDRVSIVTLYQAVFFLIYLSTFFMIIGMAALPKPMSLLLLSGVIQIIICVKLIRKF